MKKDVRISSGELFTYYYKKRSGDGKEVPVGGCTNKRLLSKNTGIAENTLMKIFTRENRYFYEDERVVIMRLFTDKIEKGKQSLSRRGKGGMEKFLKYINRDMSY